MLSITVMRPSSPFIRPSSPVMRLSSPAMAAVFSVMSSRSSLAMLSILSYSLSILSYSHLNPLSTAKHKVTTIAKPAMPVATTAMMICVSIILDYNLTPPLAGDNGIS